MSTDEYEKGLVVRRSVLGEAYVDRTLGQQDAFNEPVLTFATEAYWAKVWGRDKLPRRDSSIAVIAMLIALNKPDDLALHLQAAVRNGLTVEEIREILLMSAVYCGAPASHGAFRVASQCLAGEIKKYNESQKKPG
ncbi:MAG: 4-carboxymuconolactone decarboxylase [Alphaproteobacteria bacterium]|jgi:alkylhydroperoxidase/carboxymuconolactone decarboxylase family protein YurZ|nr:4-carboxymuconolactone decarboxylase [Alphaproteobacteria bacterium]MEA3026749.1 4-carboxymuconolactone decarboxylase [Alphaproteobacteria bacterium]